MRSVNFTPGNEVVLLRCGAEYFPALVAAIDAACTEIFLETYIFAIDETGDQVRAALKRAAARGITVNVITDWLGTGSAACTVLAHDFITGGVRYRVFNPWFRRGVVRTHRKICVIDRKLAFLGGLNINDDLRADDNFDLILPAPRWDFAVRITGPLVWNIHYEIEAQWRRLGPLNLRSRWELFKERRLKPRVLDGGPMLAALVVRDNLRNRNTIQRTCLQALGRARKSALLANPYFAPGPRLRRALESAATRGVAVTLLLGVGQFRLQDAVARSFYPRLLQSGVKIVEYRKTQLHGKVAVIDDDWATVGSSNYDGFSLLVNQEANVVVKDAAFSEMLRSHIEHGVTDGVLIRLEDFANTPWYKRLWYGTAFWLYQIMIRVITWGNQA